MKPRKWWHWPGVAGAVWCAGFMAYDVAAHDWAWAGVMAGMGVVNGVFSRHTYSKTRPPAPKPDYAKIRRLELEMGLRDPDPPPKPRPQPPPPITPLEQDGLRWLREAQAAAAKWETCPVCLRRHAGRCAG